VIRRLWTALGLFLPSSFMLAAEGEGHGATTEPVNGWLAPIYGVPTIVWQSINLLLVIGLFYYLLRKAGPRFFSDRVQSIQDQLNAALREKEEAEARLREVEAKMASLADEVAAIEREAAETAERERARIRGEAEEARERVRREASEEVARQVEEARRALRAEAAELAEQAAREILARELTAEDERHLSDRFFAGMGRKPR